MNWSLTSYAAPQSLSRDTVIGSSVASFYVKGYTTEHYKEVLRANLESLLFDCQFRIFALYSRFVSN